MPESDPHLRHRLTGVCPAARAVVISELLYERKKSVALIITEDLKQAEALSEDIKLFFSAIADKNTPKQARVDAEILIFPESIPDTRDLREAFVASSDRLNVLSKLKGRLNHSGSETKASLKNKKGKPSPALIVITTPSALLQAVPAIEKFSAHELTLVKGKHHSFNGLLTELQKLDYDCEALCEAPGHYAIRGGIIDVYPVTDVRPYRLDFFGDEIESIRAFDPVTQRSADAVETITLSASPRVRLDAARSGLADYLSPSTVCVLIEPAVLEEELRALNPDEGLGVTPIFDKCSELIAVGDLDEASTYFDSTCESTVWDTENLSHNRHFPGDDLVAQDRLEAEESARSEFLSQLGIWKNKDYALIFIAAKSGEEQRMREILKAHPKTKNIEPFFLQAGLNEGFKIKYLASTDKSITEKISLAAAKTGIIFITETEILGRQRPRRQATDQRARVQKAQVDQLLDFADLVEGDFVVHLQHGIALFRGLTKLDTAQGVREVISLEFDEGVTLHVSLSESHLLSRYVGLGKIRPQLGKIGSGRWEKARLAAERATLDVAAELLRVQARRESQPGYSFGSETEWQREFEASFPFTETRDQLKAIAETKADMERNRPMDRLICGDVGFGKTEVAIRAAFKAVQDGKQVAVLIPTTVLAQQHLNTFRERMAGYPIAVEMISRFKTPKEQKAILEATSLGQVDILIGTHRLIQEDVIFKDLGLVIIDEEQRFGVRHKEVFKRMRESVDVLSMSATPVPRTLYLALTGARDLSVIETAPTNRHPIQTIVKTYDEQVVVDAIRHEIRRGGQVFYLHNRVSTIQNVANRLTQLLPGIKVGIGHGKMDADSLEQVMTEFVAGKNQVLVCTTIIESGLDIPNCNTIIIEGADRFGLSQLYQLRGRVGRFKHQAYAYLLLHKHTKLLEIARQRLTALRQHNQLGAGFRIAMRDLELRGAGNLLGTEQSGHIVGVGFELYCQLLRQSVARLKGETAASYIRAAVKLDFISTGEKINHSQKTAGRRDDSYTAIKDAENVADGAIPIEPIQALIPAAYVTETRLRIDLYRKLALTIDLEGLKKIVDEIKDRFGAYGEEVKALILTTKIRILAEQKKLLLVECESHRLKCLRNSGRRDDWVMPGSRFPRLTAAKALLRLEEIVCFLNNLPNT